MLSGIWGKKIGMTQVFSEKNTVVPVTVIDIGNWYITGLKTQEQDGYNAIQVGLIKEKFNNQPFLSEWTKKPKNYFQMLREINLQAKPEIPMEIGQAIDYASVLATGEHVNVFGMTKGKGFQGVVKRHGFRGGPASHGPRFGRWPGSISSYRSQGKVIKGKKLPGHMGVERRVMKNLEVIKIEANANIALVKGSVPGGSGALIYLQKA
ncbi:MAG: 50S ribosomal protein L3 [Candidatus Babeliales bacterium]